MQAYHGGEGGDGSDMDGVNMAICTIEKANSIVNRLAEEKRLQVRAGSVSGSASEPRRPPCSICFVDFVFRETGLSFRMLLLYLLPRTYTTLMMSA